MRRSSDSQILTIYEFHVEEDLAVGFTDVVNPAHVGV